MLQIFTVASCHHLWSSAAPPIVRIPTLASPAAIHRSTSIRPGTFNRPFNDCRNVLMARSLLPFTPNPVESLSFRQVWSPSHSPHISISINTTSKPIPSLGSPAARAFLLSLLCVSQVCPKTHIIYLWRCLVAITDLTVSLHIPSSQPSSLWNFSSFLSTTSSSSAEDPLPSWSALSTRSRSLRLMASTSS